MRWWDGQILRAGEETSANYTVLLEEAQGYDKLEALQHHQNEKIYEKAVDIIQKYLGLDEEAENAVPNAATQPTHDNTFAFTAATQQPGAPSFSFQGFN
jgi:hypothetical protein